MAFSHELRCSSRRVMGKKDTVQLSHPIFKDVQEEFSLKRLHMRKDSLYQHGGNNHRPHQLGCSMPKVWRDKQSVAGYAKSNFLRRNFLKWLLCVGALDVCWTFWTFVWLWLVIPDSFSAYHKLKDRYNGAFAPLQLTWRLTRSVQTASCWRVSPRNYHDGQASCRSCVSFHGRFGFSCGKLMMRWS